MNKLTDIRAARRTYRGVVRAPAPPGAIDARSRARRALVCAWTIDPIAGRPVCSWREHSRDDARRAALDARGRASEIPIAA